MSAQPAERPSSPAVDSQLPPALETWRQRLAAAGISCRAVALQAGETLHDFPAADRALNEAWAALRARVSGESPVALGKSGNELLMAALVSLPTGQAGIVGALLAPPVDERTVQLVLLSLGGLQLALSAASLAHNQRAARLLELMGHVGSHTDARAGAQEWINRTAAWARGEAGDADPGFTLSLFEVRGDRPRWWVAADTAWAEKAAPAVHEATEAATRAMVEMQEVHQAPWWALPLLRDGEPVAVLVAKHAGGELAPSVLALLRASAGLAEPLLRHWREAERGLPRHVLDACRGAWRKLSGPGHLTWKVGAGLAAVLLLALLAWPVPDRVTASTVIEGRTRQLVTAPFDGFIGQVLVRPGERVSRGQPLAKLDNRDLLLEQDRFGSERDQAAGKLRQAMADRDAPAIALAQAELQQADAQLALVQAKLARADLLAPMDGLVVTGDWAQQIGAPVETGKEMFEIASSDGYRVVLHVPDRDIARVKAGQRGVLRLAGQPHAGHDFELTRVTATASVQDGVNGFRVEAAWQGDAPPLSPGMQGVGKIEVGQANLFTVWTRSSLDWLRLKLWSWWW